MSKTSLYQIYDKAAETVLGPIFTKTRQAAAIREFTEVMAASGTSLNKYPTDFALLHVGTQDENTGQIEACEPSVIYDGETYLKQLQERERGDPLTTDKKPSVISGSPLSVKSYDQSDDIKPEHIQR